MLEEEEKMMAEADTQEGSSRQEAAEQDSGTTTGEFWALTQGSAFGAALYRRRPHNGSAATCGQWHVTPFCRQPPGPGSGGC